MPDLSEYRRLAREISVDAVALVPGPNFDRAMGKSFMTNERPIVVVIPASGEPAAIVPNLELGSWDQLRFEGAVFDWRDEAGYKGAFTALANHLSIASLAVEGQVMRVFVSDALTEAMPRLQITDAEHQISNLRLIKSSKDVASMQAAITISERALERVIGTVHAGQTEKQIEQDLIQAMFAEGADSLAFTPIVVAADNSARPHGKARMDYRIQTGDALLFDFGARKDGFVADITRTFFVGEVSDEGKAVYETVLRANQMGLNVCRPGVTAHDIDDAVIGVLEASPFANRIRTKTGHGLGRDVHEAPYIMRGNNQVMRAGMVWTNEPGLYDLGNFGVRIEDDVLVTEDGCQSLTSFPKELIVLGAGRR